MTSRVLIVDGDLDIAAAMQLILEADGLEVVGIEGDGDNILPLVEETRPDLVLLDIRTIPYVDGRDVLRALVALDVPPRVLVISSGSERYGDEALGIGAAGVVEKPFDPEKLASLANDALAGRLIGLVPAEQPSPDEEEP